MKSRTGLLQAILLVVLLGASAWAQDSAAPADPQAEYPQASDSQAGPPGPDAQSTEPQAPDPPGRVARLQYMTGQVSVQPQGTGDWAQGSANRPLTNADNIWADKDSRAELDAGTGRLRISSESSLTLTNVDNNAVQVSLHQGALNVRVHHLYKGEVWEVDTPNLAFTLMKPGDYRFDVDPNGDATTVTVRKGEGEATGQGQAVRVRGGEQARFTGGTSLAHQTNDAPPPDSFDEWCEVRDKREDHSASARYVAPGVVGAGDLDDYGTWKDSPEYGEVWTPTGVAPGWAPYSYGQWSWVSPWGWTWVDDAPWGFAPFHYGRWAYIGTGWGWIPGPYWAQPWYAPALVGWFGGPGWGFGFGWGFGPRFGWCPLGFREPFRPWYGVSRGYFRNVNLSNSRIGNFNRVSNSFFSRARTGIPANHFVNAGKPGGLTAASQNTLQRGLAVHGNSAHPTLNDVKGTQSLSRVNVNPTRESMVGSKAKPGARPASGAFSRPTVSRMTPPAVSSRAAANQVAAARSGAGSNPRNMGSPMSRGSESATHGMASSPRAQDVPRPASNGSGAQPRNEPSRMTTNRNVPRPPQNSMRPFGGSSSGSTMSQPVPRSPAGSTSARNEGSVYGSRSMGNSVPRPSGRVQPAPRSYSNSSGGGYSSRAYGSSPYGSQYGGRGGYGGYPGRSYGNPYGGSYGGGRGGNAAPSRSFGSSGGSRGGSGSYHGSSGSHASSGGSGGHSSGSHGGGGHR